MGIYVYVYVFVQLKSVSVYVFMYREKMCLCICMCICLFYRNLLVVVCMHPFFSYFSREVPSNCIIQRQKYNTHTRTTTQKHIIR